jgi:general secretion pathway protein A
MAGSPGASTPTSCSRWPVATLAEYAAGNLRILHDLAADLLAAGAQREVTQLDEKLYLEIFAPPTDKPRVPIAPARAGRSR